MPQLRSSNAVEDIAVGECTSPIDDYHTCKTSSWADNSEDFGERRANATDSYASDTPTTIKFFDGPLHALPSCLEWGHLQMAHLWSAPQAIAMPPPLPGVHSHGSKTMLATSTMIRLLPPIRILSSQPSKCLAFP